MTLCARTGFLWLAAAAVLAVSRPALAFELEGTADFDVSYEDEDTPGFTVVTLAGFDLVDPGTRLILFAEYGPDRVVAGRTDRAGQLFVAVPTRRLAAGTSVRLDATDYDVELSYEEWVRGGATVFEGVADAGWIEVRYTKSGGDLVLVDAVFSLRVLDPARDETRVLDGVMFGGDVPTNPPPDIRPGPSPRVRRVERGCGSSSTIVVDPYYDDPYYEPPPDDGGCGNDGTTSSDGYSNDEPTCSGDSYDSGSDTTSSNDSCAGDDTGGSSSTSSNDSPSCDDSCQGDDTSASAAVALGPFVRDSQTVVWLARHIHLALPLGFWLFARRRERDRQRGQATARTPRC